LMGTFFSVVLSQRLNSSSEISPLMYCATVASSSEKERRDFFEFIVVSNAFRPHGCNFAEAKIDRRPPFVRV
jgi:hypothetical protein